MGQAGAQTMNERGSEEKKERDKNVGNGGWRDNRGSDEGLMNSDSHLTCIQFRNCLSACGLAAYAIDIRKFK